MGKRDLFPDASPFVPARNAAGGASMSALPRLAMDGIIGPITRRAVERQQASLNAMMPDPMQGLTTLKAALNSLRGWPDLDTVEELARLQSAINTDTIDQPPVISRESARRTALTVRNRN